MLEQDAYEGMRKGDAVCIQTQAWVRERTCLKEALTPRPVAATGAAPQAVTRWCCWEEWCRIAAGPAG